MTFKVLDFYRKVEDVNLFVSTLKDPTFCILVNRDSKSRELVLNLKGDYPYVSYPDLECFEEEAYKNYMIISDFLTGDSKDSVRINWGLTNEEYRNLVFELYKLLVNNHSYYGWFKKKLLILLGYLKFNTGKVEA
mgnify:CR=1 FL=1